MTAGQRLVEVAARGVDVVALRGPAPRIALAATRCLDSLMSCSSVGSRAGESQQAPHLHRIFICFAWPRSAQVSHTQRLCRRSFARLADLGIVLHDHRNHRRCMHRSVSSGLPRAPSHGAAEGCRQDVGVGQRQGQSSGIVGKLFSKSFGTSRKATNKSASTGRKGRGKMPSRKRSGVGVGPAA